MSGILRHLYYAVNHRACMRNMEQRWEATYMARCTEAHMVSHG